MLSHAQNALDPLHACVDLYLLRHSSAILYISGLLCCFLMILKEIALC